MPGWEPASEIFSLGNLGKLLKLSSPLHKNTNSTHSSSCFKETLQNSKFRTLLDAQ